MRSAILMAAGKGTRMESKKPKVLHEICQKPMIAHILDKMDEIHVDQVVTIVGYGHDEIEKAVKGRCEFALQEPQLGTGHAVAQAQMLKQNTGYTLVANGDCPRIQSATYERMYNECEGCAMVVLTAVVEDAKSYGRVVRDENGFIKKIVEFKDCNEEEKKIREINTGIYCFDNQALFQNLGKLKNDNAQKEYYITDMVSILNQEQLKVKAVVLEDPKEAEGVNDKAELAEANQWMQQKINQKWMKKGVVMIDPSTVSIADEVILGKEVTIYPGCTLSKKTVVGDNTTILPGCWLENAVIEEGCMIISSYILDSTIEAGRTVGPFAHIQGNQQLSLNADK